MDRVVVNLEALNEPQYAGCEMEVMFNNYTRTNRLSLGAFARLCAHLRTLERTAAVQLDLSYSKSPDERYRLEIAEPNRVMAPYMRKKNFMVFLSLMDKRESGRIELIRKERRLVQDFDELDLRLRISEERPPTPAEEQELLGLREQQMYQLRFRLKSRISAVLYEDAQMRLIGDATHVQTHMEARHVASAPSSYEFEIEVHKKRPVIDLDPVYRTLAFYRRLLDDAAHLCPRSQREAALDSCFALLQRAALPSALPAAVPGAPAPRKLSLMQPVSMELIHLVDKIQLGYTVTDKADGERFVLLVVGSEAFLIDVKMEVRKLLDLPDRAYDMSLFDGEYVQARSGRRHYMIFDALVDRGRDLRTNELLLDRLQAATEFVRHYWNMQYRVLPLDADRLLREDMAAYYKELEAAARQSGGKAAGKAAPRGEVDPLVWVKYFYVPRGTSEDEVYRAMAAMDGVYREHDLYERDGFILTPLKQEYTNTAEKLKSPVYKWKPSQFNSVDLYVEFEKNERTGRVENYFDRTQAPREAEDSGIAAQSAAAGQESKEAAPLQLFRKCFLYVGRTTGAEEHPVPFPVSRFCLLPLDADELVRDLAGGVVLDKTVVEFTYDNDPLLRMEQRWRPLRTRFEKTQIVQQHRKKYGNNEKIVMKIWRSINERIDMDTIAQLATNYEPTMAALRSRIDRFAIAEEAEKQAYYQKQSNLAKAARQFNNFIKTFICQNYCSPADGRRKAVIDFGVGRGGDILRMYNSKVASYVGFDRDMNGIISPQDGCISRYTQMKNSKKYPNFPEMVFFNADAGAPFQLDAQLQVLATKSAENTRLIRKYLNQQYDVLNCQFMVHYLFRDESTLQALCDNVNRVLRVGGYMLVTTYDGQMIHDLLQRNGGTATSHYVDTDGRERRFMEIKQLYELPADGSLDRTGLAVSYFNASFMEDEGVTEYLVAPAFFKRVMAERCGLLCLESDSFEGVFDRFRPFFKQSSRLESIDETRKYLANVAQYFDETSEMNRQTYDFIKTHRYYVFVKTH